MVRPWKYPCKNRANEKADKNSIADICECLGPVIRMDHPENISYRGSYPFSSLIGELLRSTGKRKSRTETAVR